MVDNFGLRDGSLSDSARDAVVCSGETATQRIDDPGRRFKAIIRRLW